MNTAESLNPTPMWRFWVPLLFQTALILSVPVQAIYTHITGKTVILQTVRSDPYSPMLADSQKLRYDISRPDNLRTLPGWTELLKQQQASSFKKYPEPGTGFYVILERPPQRADGVPQPWKPVSVRRDRPKSLPANQVALKALSGDGFIEYGLETYYIPEDQRNEINLELGDVQKPNIKQPKKTPPVVIEIKVDPQGQAVPVSLWVRARQFRF